MVQVTVYKGNHHVAGQPAKGLLFGLIAERCSKVYNVGSALHYTTWGSKTGTVSGVEVMVSEPEAVSMAATILSFK